MKTLYLNRHAKSSWDYPQLKDFDRPLSGRGRRDASMMGAVLKENGINPQLFLSSPAVRAITTARLIAKELEYDESSIKEDSHIYAASRKILLDVLKALDDSVDSVIMFGHNPEFTELANELTNNYIDNIPTCGCVIIEFDIDSWNNLAKGRFTGFEFPKKHR